MELQCARCILDNRFNRAITIVDGTAMCRDHAIKAQRPIDRAVSQASKKASRAGHPDNPEDL